MKKTISIFILVLVMFHLIRCHPEEEIMPESIMLSAVVNNVSEYGGHDGSIDLTVTGGTPPYAYIWSNQSLSEDIECLSAGTYAVLVSDAGNATQSDTFIITEPALDTLHVSYALVHTSEPGVSDGSVDITITGGYPPYLIIWSNGSTLEDQVNLGTGSYTAVINDSKGQAVTINMTISFGVTDIDGNTYPVVKIGDQLWMQENLRVTHAPDGTPVNGYAYNNNESHVSIYGRLYTWDVAMNHTTVEMSQGICPSGWHIPSDDEFKTLEIFLGMTQAEADMENVWRGTGVGTSLIIGGSSGYDACLSGRRLPGGTYSLLSMYEYIWTSTEYGENAWRRCLDINSDECGRWNTFPKSYGFSVRCIKDE
ncbi:MAG: hypothetical protein JW830_00175 [Bacteroidales bacterium]|nr:hypothetical protein [Bacteroidales bacterium]